MKKYETKREVIEDFMANGLVMLHIDSRVDGVLVPAAHQGQPALRLNLSHRFKDAEIIISDDGIIATLTYSGTPFRTYLPWKSVYAVTSKVMNPPAAVFADDVPTEVKVRARQQIEDDVFSKASDLVADAQEIRAELRLAYGELSPEELEIHRLAIEDILTARRTEARWGSPSKPSVTPDLAAALEAGGVEPPSPAPGTRRFTVIKGGKD